MYTSQISDYCYSDYHYHESGSTGIILAGGPYDLAYREVPSVRGYGAMLSFEEWNPSFTSQWYSSRLSRHLTNDTFRLL